jgi:hypothetical protein
MDIQNTVSAGENPFLKGFQENQATEYNPSVEGAGNDDFLKSMQDEQLKSIKEAIEDIQILITERDQLHKEMFNHVDRVKMDLNNFLLESSSSLTLAEKLDIRKTICELEELKIGERLNAWRDIANLKKELRERLRELTERESRADVIDQIMEN